MTTRAIAQPPAAGAAPAPDRAILLASGIRKSFRMGDSTVTVLKSAEIAIRAGEFVAIEGRSGSGKSTLLHIMGGLDSVDEGTVQFEGVDYTSRPPQGAILLLRRLSRLTRITAIIVAVAGLASWIASTILIRRLEPGIEPTPFVSSLSTAWPWLAGIAGGLLIVWIGLLSTRAIIHHIREAPLARRRNRDFGFVFQFYYLLPELNVLENTALAPMIGGNPPGVRSRKERTERAKQLLTQLGMEHRLKHRPAQLSGGERQRVAIARALMNKPKVLFADEPTGNLDAETGKQIMTVLETLHREHGQTIVMVTHDRSVAKKADRALVLKDGKLEKPQD